MVYQTRSTSYSSSTSTNTMTNKESNKKEEECTLLDVWKLLRTVASDVKDNKTCLESLEGRHNELVLEVREHDDRLQTLERKYDDLMRMELQRVCDVEAMKIDALYREMHSKRPNILIYGIEEENAWESREQSEIMVTKFLKDTLNIDQTISISDAHRLPLSKGKTGPRPLIFKLQKLLDKKVIGDNLQN